MDKRKRVLSIVLSLLIVSGLIIGSLGQIVLAEKAPKKITLVHLNDIHGRLKEDEKEGALGFAKIQTKLKELRKENPNLLLLNAGDSFHGTTLVNVTQGETMVALMNQLGFDAMTPGNHDFNYGYKRLLELKELANFLILANNLVDEKTGQQVLNPYLIKEVDGLKLGIFGVTTEESKFKSHPKNTEGLKFLDPIEASQATVKKLREEKVDLIIGLGHLGVEGTTLTTSEELLKQLEGIDLFIDGHSHEITNKKVGDSLLVQAGDYTRNMGLVQLEVEDGQLKNIEASLFSYEDGKDLSPDKKIEEEIENIDAINKPILDVVVGESKLRLDGERKDVRTKETNLGNLIADTMLESGQGDLAFTNGGGIRASIEKGPVKVNDIITAVPFTNTLAVIEVTASEIIQALERGVDSYPEEAGHFPQVAGISFSFDPNQAPGGRVDRSQIKIQGKPLDPQAKYKLVTNDFIAAGGDGYTMFQGKPFIGEGGLLSDLLKEKFQNSQALEPKLEDRIIKIDVDSYQLNYPQALNLSIDGKPIIFTEATGYPIIEDNRTLVPLRVVSENLGHKVEWLAQDRMVKIDDNISLKIGEKFVNVGSKKIEMDTSARIIDGKSYLPIRFVSEALGYSSLWDASTRTVNIITIIEDLAPAPAA